MLDDVKVLSQLGMPAPNRPMHDAFNQELLREKMYNFNALVLKVQFNMEFR